ncbi:MAG: DUF2267 domain-containing protein [Bacteroidales bacterium]
MALNFAKYEQEGNAFVSRLAEALGHPEEIGRTGIVLRAVLHTLRDRITISESLNLLSQLPMFLKAIYVDNWKYREKPLRFNTIEDFDDQVKKYQEQYGEQEFIWEKSTEEIVKIVLSELGTYVSQGELENIKAQVPEELEELFNLK